MRIKIIHIWRVTVQPHPRLAPRVLCPRLRVFDLSELHRPKAHPPADDAPFRKGGKKRQEVPPVHPRPPQISAVIELKVRPDRRRVLLGVGAIYDGASAGGELRLPYHLTCLRAYVDHAEMTTPIRLGEDALVIRL